LLASPLRWHGRRILSDFAARTMSRFIEAGEIIQSVTSHRSSFSRSMESPGVMAREGAHETVEEILRNEKRGRLLDVPAGHGGVSCTAPAARL
jgi:hypothetical protein